MRIAHLKVNNVLKLSAVEMSPDGNGFTVIGGKNKAGKSSLINCIAMALGGLGSCPPKPVRDGKKKGSIILDLEEIVVERRFSVGGDPTITIRNAEGAVQKSPQKLLDALCSRISFDPSEFQLMDRKKQRDVLQKLVGIDFTAIDKKRDEAFQKRTEVNRRLKETEARVKAAPQYPDAPEKETSAAELLAEMKRRQEVNRANDETRSAILSMERTIETCASDLADAEESLKAATERVDQERQLLKHAQEGKEILVAKSLALVDADVAAIQKRIADSDEVNRKVRANFARKQELDVLRSHEAQAEKLTAEIEDCDENKAALLEAADFPVPGLGFDAEGVTFNGVPYPSQCSSAETIQVGMAIALAGKPKLPIVLIRNGALLDDEQRAIVRQTAIDRGAQVFFEIVGDSPDAQVYIEDGHVRGEGPEDEDDDIDDESPVGAAVEGSGEGP